MSEDSGIQIDSDWKAEARAEKERLKEKSAPASAGPSAASPGTPGTPGTPRRARNPPLIARHRSTGQR